MRLLSITVRNYRVHRDLHLDLAPGANLIGGPNESGKSTLAEAMHRALFLKSKITGEARNAMLSRHGGHPEVTVRFEQGGATWEVQKRFSGANGTTVLTESGGGTWNNEAAEDKLAGILGAGEAIGGRGAENRIKGQWAHLWVWQGQAGNNPADFAGEQKDTLIERLQAAGGAAVAQSERDARVSRLFAGAEGAIFTPTGQVRSTSDLAKAEREKSAAEAAAAAAGEILRKLEQAVRQCLAADALVASARAELPALESQLARTTARLAEAGELGNAARLQEMDLQAKSAQKQILSNADAEILCLGGLIANGERALGPQRAECERLENEVAACRAAAGEAGQALAAAAAATVAGRAWRDLAQACLNHLEKRDALAALLARLGQVEHQRAAKLAIEEELAAVPPATVDDVKKLYKLQDAATAADAALQAMATGIELLSGDTADKVYLAPGTTPTGAPGPARSMTVPVLPDRAETGSPETRPGRSCCVQGTASGDTAVHTGPTRLLPGKQEIFTSAIELSIGGVLLRVTPGGGMNLQQAWAKAGAARRAITDALAALGVPGVEDAAEAVGRRRDLSQRLLHATGLLETLGADGIEAAILAARAATHQAIATRDTMLPGVPGFPLPEGAIRAKSLLDDANGALKTLEQAETVAASASQATATRLQSAGSSQTAHLQSLAGEERGLQETRIKRDLLLASHGDDTARAAHLATLLAAESEAAEVLARTRTALAGLQPDLLESDRQRLGEAVSRWHSTSQEAMRQRAAAEALLRNEGASDPQAAFLLARARAAQATEKFASLERRAHAIRKLAGLFKREEQNLADRLSAPFAGKISAYLQCLFGPEARATVDMEPDAFGALAVIRRADGAAALDFNVLSGGAKEQIAAAARLAMAEILAENHSGSLPVVFDDAFAYSDPERVQSLQRMLFLAAKRQLQIIVLACNPSDYSGLGAATHHLPPPA